MAIEELISYFKPCIFLLQKHLLMPANLNKLDTFTDYFNFGSSAMSNSVQSGLLRSRPFGALSILSNNTLPNLCKTVNCCDRFAFVEIANYIIVSVYLPCVGTVNRLNICEDLLEDVWAWRVQYVDHE